MHDPARSTAVTPTVGADGIAIGEAQNYGSEFRCLAGVACWFCLVPGVVGLLGPEPIAGVVLLAIVPSLLALARWSDRQNSERFATLYRDRLALHWSKTASTEVEWTDVSDVRWPGNSGGSIRLSVRSDSGDAVTEFVKLERVVRADRAGLVAYLRIAGRKATHDNWPAFCARTAAPLLSRVKADKPWKDRYTPEEVRRLPCPKRAAIGILMLADARPFVGGLLAPAVLLATVILTVSRDIYWTLAATIGASAVINIRLVWGVWIEPVTEVIGWIVGVLFALGLVSAPSDHTEESSDVSRAMTLFWFSMAIVGGPLFANAQAIGWIPRLVVDELTARLFGYAFLATLMMPVFIGARKRTAAIKAESVEGSPSCRLWDQFERRFRMPAATPPGPGPAVSE